jgi:hypothetical protein|tara:strand:+ start:135 stop:374 length:240 start_codon:yes stop_codon:yes gene_type:complete
MNSIIETVHSVVGGLTSILLGLLGLGIVANILFGANMFIGDVIGNITGIVASLGEQGLVGLIVAIIIIHILGIGDKAKK